MVRKILLPADVVLPTTYLNDVRFHPGQGKEGMAFITDSSDKGPNGIIVVDLAYGESWFDEGNKGGGSDGPESDAAGCIYASDYEHNAVLRRKPGGDRTRSGDPIGSCPS